MSLEKFAAPPDQAGYTVEDGVEVLRAQLDGGAARYRRDIIGASRIVNVQWTFSQEGYLYFRAFYRTSTAQGSKPFLIDLVLDDVELTEHEAYFIPGSVRLNNVSGHRHVVAAQLEVTPTDPDASYDEALVMIYTEYGVQGAQSLLLGLEHLVEIDFGGSLQ